MDVLTPEHRKKNMQAIRNKNTKIEELLAKALREKGLRYRRNNSGVFGKPDFTFKRLKIAIFCDSEYFHGKDWETNKLRIRTNSGFWITKIERNIARDELVNNTLMNDGWKVIRFWGEDIIRRVNDCVQVILKEIEIKNSQIHRNQGKAKNPA